MHTVEQHSKIQLVEQLWFFAQAHSYFPSTLANNIQIMKACSAFSQIGQPTRLVVPRRLSSFRHAYMIQGDIWKANAVPHNFEIDWCHYPYPFHHGQESLYAPAVGWYAAHHHIRLAYTRSHWIAVVLCQMGIPTTLEMHDFPLPMLGLVLREVQRGRLMGLVCISQALAKEFSAFGFPSESIMVAHDGVDIERFEPRLTKSDARAKINLPHVNPIVCYAGHLYQGRGIEMLLACAKRLPNIMFVFVGGTEEDVARYKTQVAEEYIQNVCFVGHVSNALIPSYLYAADVLVMPYTLSTSTHPYMSPMKMFEYLAAGRAIIASDFPVLREILHNQQNAILVEPENTKAFIEAIQNIISNHLLAEQLSQAALHTATQYTWKIRQKNILLFIKQRLIALGFTSPFLINTDCLDR